MYSVEFKQSVSKDLKKIPKQFVKKIFANIDKLQINPYKQNIKKLVSTESFFRLRVGDYRIVFQISNNERKIIIYYISHRKEVYKNL